MIDLLKAGGGENIKVFGGGGGVIVPAETGLSCTSTASPHLFAGRRQGMGLQGMINDVVSQCDVDLASRTCRRPNRCSTCCARAIAVRWRRSSPGWKNGVRRQPEGSGSRQRPSADPRTRHHRHRRRRQVPR